LGWITVKPLATSTPITSTGIASGVQISAAAPIATIHTNRTGKPLVANASLSVLPASVAPSKLPCPSPGMRATGICHQFKAIFNARS
jgi:hypothetical protein